MTLKEYYILDQDRYPNGYIYHNIPTLEGNDVYKWYNHLFIPDHIKTILEDDDESIIKEVVDNIKVYNLSDIHYKSISHEGIRNKVYEILSIKEGAT